MVFMGFLVSGKQINIGQSLQEYVGECLAKVVAKYFDNEIGGDVVFSKQGHMFACKIMANAGTSKKLTLIGNAESDDVYSAFDMSLYKIEKQLRRYKDKIKKHYSDHKAHLYSEGGEASITGRKYVIASTPFSPDREIGDIPVVIEERPTDICVLTVGEAIMKMDLAQLPALLFKNAHTGRLNVVYHRADGNISLVDPSN
jgi:ribosomal subunit interface protein